MKDKFSRVGVVIVGAGTSQRMGTDKVLLPLGDKPLLAWPVDICQNCEPIDQIVIVLNKSNLNSGEDLITERGWSKVVKVCLGGKRRQDSVKRGLEKLEGCAWVIIHDAARPFLTQEMIEDGLEAAWRTGAAAAAVQVKDTIKLSDDEGVVNETLDRKRLWIVQTPQVFRFDIITAAYEKIADDVTDDAGLVERLGYKVRLYSGSYMNIKITTTEDLALAEVIIKGR